LEKTIGMANLVAFTPAGQLRRYNSAQEILQEFVKFRLPFYGKRKMVKIHALQTELSRLANRARFITMVVEEKALRVRNTPKKEIVAQLQKHSFPLIPKRGPKRGSKRTAASTADSKENGDEPNENDNRQNDDDDDESGAEVSPVGKTEDELERGYDYLLGMPLWSLTLERVNDLKKLQTLKNTEIDALQKTDPSQLWVRDIDAFVSAFDKHETAELARLAATNNSKKKEPVKAKRSLKASKRKTPTATSETRPDESRKKSRAK
jgi:DNA topoisomerase-2